MHICTQFFVNQYLNTTMDAAAFVEKKMKQMTTAMAKASSTSAFYTSTPVCLHACMHACMYECMNVCVCLSLCVLWSKT